MSTQNMCVGIQHLEVESSPETSCTSIASGSRVHVRAPALGRRNLARLAETDPLRDLDFARSFLNPSHQGPWRGDPLVRLTVPVRVL